jgi:Protein of unknown function (DUF3307)
VTWSAVLLALIVSHAVGDVLLQTDWQAVNKVRGLRDSGARVALFSHVATYMLAFIPALVWIGLNEGAWRAVGVAALIALPHMLIDDGRIVAFWLRDVKGVQRPPAALAISVDQCFHLVCLLGAALVAVA